MDILKQYGLKNTKTRSSILKLLAKESPLTPEQISEKLKKEKIKLSSIYRNLSIFEEENILIKSIGLDGVSYYQLNDSRHKHRLFCNNCCKMIIVDQCPIDQIVNKIEKDTKFEIHSHSFEFSGLCKDCK